MVRLTPEIKQAFLNSLYYQAQQSGPTPLYDALNAFQQNCFSALSTGRLVVSHTGAGKAVTFQVPRIDQQFRQEEVLAFSQELINTYNSALTTLALTKTNDTTQDAAIFAAMMADDRFQEVTEVYTDHTWVGWPYRA